MEEKITRCVNSYKRQVIHNKNTRNIDYFHCQMSSNITVDKIVYIDYVPK